MVLTKIRFDTFNHILKLLALISRSANEYSGRKGLLG